MPDKKQSPPPAIAQMVEALTDAANSLQRIKDNPQFEEVFREGEQTSIRELFKIANGRRKLAEGLQQSFIP